MRGIKRGSEADQQAQFFAWLQIYSRRFPDLEMCYAIPNEGNRSPVDGYRRKLTGRKRGVPDVHLPVATDEYAGLYIEFKVKPNRPQPEQRQWMEKLRIYGHRVELCYSWHEAANIIIDYLQLPIETVAEVKVSAI